MKTKSVLWLVVILGSLIASPQSAKDANDKPQGGYDVQRRSKLTFADTARMLEQSRRRMRQQTDSIKQKIKAL